MPGTLTISPAGTAVITMNNATTTYGSATSFSSSNGNVVSVQYATPSGNTVLVHTLTSSDGGGTWSDGLGGSITVNPSITGVPIT